MQAENHNPHVIPGRPQYNPQGQSVTETDFYLSQIYPGYSDPTQVPIRPGDTEIAMRRPSQPTHDAQSSIPSPVAVDLGTIRQQIEAMSQYIQSQQQFTRVSTPPSAPIAPTRVPIVVDLQINLNLNLNINPQQNG
jgi:hypothetical protein